MSEQTIETLVREAQSGCRCAYGELVQRFEQTVFAIILRRLRNQAEALEVTQDVFMQAMRKISQLREPERFAGWLRQIATRMAINRAVRRPKETLRHPETFDSENAEPDTPLDLLLQNEQRTQVRDGLSQLRDLDRQTLQAFYFDGMSLQEMSTSFNSPVGTIKRRLHTARHRLRDQLVDMQPA
jgi:RNA polymerase sigma-70 factor, ECF subfamily